MEKHLTIDNLGISKDKTKKGQIEYSFLSNEMIEIIVHDEEDLKEHFELCSSQPDRYILAELIRNDQGEITGGRFVSKIFYEHPIKKGGIHN